MSNDTSPDRPSKSANTAPQSKLTRTPKAEPCDWLSDQDHAIRGEQALWVAVITQAMMDALSRAKSSEARYHRNEAINWLTGNSKDFITVCLHAGLDPNYVRRKAKRSLLNPQNWRADAGKGKRYEERKAYRKRKRQEQASPAQASPCPPGNVICGHWHH